MSYLPILVYHRVLKGPADKVSDPSRISISDTDFRGHMRWLKNRGYRTVSLDDYGRRLRGNEPYKGKCLAITFDDGYEEVLTLAAPILKEYGYSATVFAVSGQLGGSNAWDNGGMRLLSAPQYRELDGLGFEIGAHTCSHVHLTRVDERTARQEIANSKKGLEDLLGRSIRSFAYPYGETNDTVDHFVSDAGFEAGFATDNAPRAHNENLFRIRRVVIFPGTNIWNLSWKVQHWYPYYQDWMRRR